MFKIEFASNNIFESIALLETNVSREVTNWLVDMAIWFKADLKNKVPVKTGVLKNSIRYELQNSSKGGTANFYAVHYGKIVDEGARPFSMTKSNKPPFAFQKGGEQMFSFTVQHPGIKPRNFTIASLEDGAKEAERLMSVIAARIYNGVKV